MLKISVVESRSERCLILEGKLFAPWVAELRTACQKARANLQNLQLVNSSSAFSPSWLTTVTFFRSMACGTEKGSFIQRRFQLRAEDLKTTQSFKDISRTIPSQESPL
jgi:hypothetical protein